MSMPTETMETMTTKPAAGKGAAAKPGKREESGAGAAERELALEMIRRAKERGSTRPGRTARSGSSPGPCRRPLWTRR